MKKATVKIELSQNVRELTSSLTILVMKQKSVFYIPSTLANSEFIQKIDLVTEEFA